MRIFKTRLFSKWARKENLTDEMLNQAVDEMERGLIDAKTQLNILVKTGKLIEVKHVR